MKYLKKSAMSEYVIEIEQRNLHMYPRILITSCRRHKRLSVRCNNLLNIATERKREGGLQLIPPSPLLYHSGGKSFYVRLITKLG